ncbi:phosphate signaling complex protein PhoU [Tuwongella immobilis]|uniref:Phosphate-specific transport system accessory protein PhoU n=1 Tax=Tuwongella immobilis TaxID=692036 RepID=A0A6C2YQ52_9BACT|nr:phosphate signaling complex protein PhoU [Tuwongella immobilis]VIP03441.1 phosphate uptake : Phosphate-specific transport system accessory protein PhoU OS=Pirellula staleyi (strain ATCC 27377 / DSM 6068 / ICPB 4128) GN=Psta_2595 PE=3 SV=1: PhoU: PhoU [Tuwongella immobilis]VTS04254.1 phosphate uptake : Phosphate-specific transport system accessory protein PhoU OS=Pirellula staleyi (strain ATCC 27377 / DSM 6068 / ICPB 4128) GN=Psta_2595 PE=3 SV=1: PhoU: PhoU [Tuwongella immobilis]
MSKHLERDLEQLQRQILTLASMVEEAIYKSLQSLEKRDPLLAQEVINNDHAVDSLENEVYEECLKILALHQPVASDLRRIASVFMINTDLERMGDLAVDIAERTLALSPSEFDIMPDKLHRMTDLTTGMVRQSLDAFVNLDSRQARRVIRLDDEVDRYNAEIIQELIVKMKTNPEIVEAGISLFSATRHLERIADHATNIAEDVVYLVEGELVRHRPVTVEPE